MCRLVNVCSYLVFNVSAYERVFFCSVQCVGLLTCVLTECSVFQPQFVGLSTRVVTEVGIVSVYVEDVRAHNYRSCVNKTRNHRSSVDSVGNDRNRRC